MDICFINTNNKIQVIPSSVHGMLWLQTHFENDQWEEISSQQVVLSIEDSKLLQEDAIKSGLMLNSLTSWPIRSNKIKKLVK